MSHRDIRVWLWSPGQKEQGTKRPGYAVPGVLEEGAEVRKEMVGKAQKALPTS